MRKLFFLFFAIALFLPVALFAQEAPVEEPSEIMLYVALAFNVGLIGVLVQLLKTKVLPTLKEKYPFLIPLIAMGIGVGSKFIFDLFGIDISPIAGVFESGIVSGALASSSFVVLKEIGNAANGKL